MFVKDAILRIVIDHGPVDIRDTVEWLRAEYKLTNPNERSIASTLVKLCDHRKIKRINKGIYDAIR